MTPPPRTPLLTAWADQVDRNAPLPEYPRPQLVRDRWINLNGVWDFAIVPREQPRPEQWQGEIVVPFPVESYLSGVGQVPGAGSKLWYKRKFAKPQLQPGERVLLQFGAVDWQATVFVNGQALGVHEGGHDPFSFDITNVLREEAEQELIVAVWDPTDAGAQPRGKQSLHPKGIWYMPVTGIWQTVWLEVVPAAYIHGLRLTPEFDRSSVRVSVNLRGPRKDMRLNVRILAEGQIVAERTLTEFDSLIDFSQAVEIRIPTPRHWYYHCDRIGLIVWQDMPSSLRTGEPSHLPPRLQPLDGVFTAEDDAQFRAELRAMIDALRHFPCITSWVTFNECWGQHSTNSILAWVRNLDPTRMVNGPSGWNDLGYGDTIDKHEYPGPGMWPAQPGRASVLGEFGGLGLPVPGHLWQEQANWGYRDSDRADDLVVHYDSMLRQLRPLIHRGLAAAVYTQLTDVEGEVNGMITYDRKVLKITAERLAELHLPLTGSITLR